MGLSRLSRVRLAEVVGAELGAYFAAQAAGSPRRFWLPGIDPFAYDDPAQVIAALYRSWQPAQRRKLTGALLDLAGERATRLPLEAVEVLLLAVALMQEQRALQPMVQILNARRDLGPARHGAFVTALQVARGFGPVRPAWDSIDQLAGFDAFPEDLVFDAFEARLADPHERWERWFERLEFKMLKACSIGRVPAVRRRLRGVAQEMSRVLAERDIERGLKHLLGQPLSPAAAAEWPDILQPRQMLATALCAQAVSPFVLVGPRLARAPAALPRPPARPQPPPPPPREAGLPAAIVEVGVDEEPRVLEEA